ncbi:dnajc21 [Symbiodinium sp. KB8]|nr:dnajc21 [Symbiodinium sp. KB8]
MAALLPEGAVSHYVLLGVLHTSSQDEIRKAHRLLALKWHPDKVEDPKDEIAVRVATQQFQLLQAAYEVLSDPARRRKYDESLGLSGLGPLGPSSIQAPSTRRTSSSWEQSEALRIHVPSEVASIAAAVDRLSIGGGEIFVAGGTYHGLIVISKPLVRLVCKSADKAIIKGQVVFRECAGGAQLSGFVIDASCSGGAIDLKGVVGNVQIDHCDISNDSSAGVVLEGCSGSTFIQSCRVHGCKYDGLGLHLLSGDASHTGLLKVENSTFENNGYDGLYLGDPRFSARLLGSSVIRNSRYGVLVRGTDFSMESCSFAENEKESVKVEEFVQKANPRGTQRTGKAREVAADLPEGWRAFRNTEGLVYYYHMASGKTRWSAPGEDAELDICSARTSPRGVLEAERADEHTSRLDTSFNGRPAFKKKGDHGLYMFWSQQFGDWKIAERLQDDGACLGFAEDMRGRRRPWLQHPPLRWRLWEPTARRFVPKRLNVVDGPEVAGAAWQESQEDSDDDEVPWSRPHWSKWSTADLIRWCDRRNIDLSGCFDREAVVDRVATVAKQDMARDGDDFERTDRVNQVRVASRVKTDGSYTKPPTLDRRSSLYGRAARPLNTGSSLSAAIEITTQEFVCPELRLAMCHAIPPDLNVKEAIRIIMQCLVVCRSLGGTQPIDLKAVVSELFDVEYLKINDSQLVQEVERLVEKFSEILENNADKSGRAQLVFNLYTAKNRKQSIWNILVGSDEKIVFEQWRIPVAVQPLNRYLNPADNLREEANLQASASQQVQQVLHYVIARANAKVEHLPPPDKEQTAYNFDVAFLSGDGKDIGAGSLLRQGLGSSLQTIRQMPYMA